MNSCDIKPENVLLESKQLPYRVKLADFGLGEGLLDVQGAVSIAYASICCCECFHLMLRVLSSGLLCEMGLLCEASVDRYRTGCLFSGEQKAHQVSRLTALLLS